MEPVRSRTTMADQRRDLSACNRGVQPRWCGRRPAVLLGRRRGLRPGSSAGDLPRARGGQPRDRNADQRFRGRRDPGLPAARRGRPRRRPAAHPPQGRDGATWRSRPATRTLSPSATARSPTGGSTSTRPRPSLTPGSIPSRRPPSPAPATRSSGVGSATTRRVAIAPLWRLSSSRASAGVRSPIEGAASTSRTGSGHAIHIRRRGPSGSGPGVRRGTGGTSPSPSSTTRSVFGDTTPIEVQLRQRQQGASPGRGAPPAAIATTCRSTSRRRRCSNRWSPTRTTMPPTPSTPRSATRDSRKSRGVRG